MAPPSQFNFENSHGSWKRQTSQIAASRRTGPRYNRRVTLDHVGEMFANPMIGLRWTNHVSIAR